MLSLVSAYRDYQKENSFVVPTSEDISPKTSLK